MTRHYTVEIEKACQVPDVEADTPKQALKNVLRELGICYASIRNISADTKTQYRKAKVSLLGGTRESVSYFEVSFEFGVK
jgi:hypothetical protein